MCCIDYIWINPNIFLYIHVRVYVYIHTWIEKKKTTTTTRNCNAVPSASIIQVEHSFIPTKLVSDGYFLPNSDNPIPISQGKSNYSFILYTIRTNFIWQFHYSSYRPSFPGLYIILSTVQTMYKFHSIISTLWHCFLSNSCPCTSHTSIPYAFSMDFVLFSRQEENVN